MSDGGHRYATANRRLRVVHVNGSDDRGGARRACARLDAGLRAAGIDSHMLEQPPVCSSDAGGRGDVISRVYVSANRTPISNTHFSLPLGGIDLSLQPEVRGADVVHLHWVASMQTPRTLQRLLALDTVVVWTLHDFAPFTGGCHYPAGCAGYESSCSDCPQLHADPFDVPAAVLRDKLDLIGVGNLTLVAPSSWMAERAQASALFRSARVEVIPNGVDTAVFRPREEARGVLGLSEERTYILCGAGGGGEVRKGLPALARVVADACGRRDLRDRGVAVLCVGDVPEELSVLGVEVIPLGLIADEEAMALAFSAADVFVLPSLEDNTPNMVVESLACATPVVAFGVGGVPELVVDGVTGRVASRGDERGLADALASVLLDPELARGMGERGRSLACERYSSSTQAACMTDLYRGLLDRPRRQARLAAAPALRAVDPGPALGALVEPLTVYCLEEEVRNLRRRVQAGERARMVEQREAAARLARAEAECEARLRVIEELDAHRAWSEAELERRRSIGLRAVGAACKTIRFGDWWYSKIPPLLAVAYLQVAISGSYGLWSLLPWLVLSVACVAAFGHVVNDSLDGAADLRAGKPNAIARRGRVVKTALAASLAAAAFAPTFTAGYPTGALALLGVNLLLPIIYSFPATRLKERGVAGLVCDVAGSHVVPTLFVLSALQRGSDAVSVREWVFAGVAVVWSAALGLKGILHHQLADRPADIASGTVTFATTAEVGGIERWLARFNVYVECPLSAILAVVVAAECPLAAVALLGYVFVESLKYRLGFHFALSGDPRTVRRSYPFVNETFYVLWLPLAAALQVALLSRAWLWAPFLQIAAFLPTVRLHGADYATVARAARERYAVEVPTRLRRRAS